MVVGRSAEQAWPPAGAPPGLELDHTSWATRLTSCARKCQALPTKGVNFHTMPGSSTGFKDAEESHTGLSPRSSRGQRSGLPVVSAPSGGHCTTPQTGRCVSDRVIATV